MHVFTQTGDAAAAGGMATFGVFGVIWAVLLLVAGWKLFAKAGQPGWVAIIPIVNSFGLLKIVHRPLWWFLLLLIPLVNIVVVIILADLAKAFGKGVGMTVLLILLTPIGVPRARRFGDATYELEPDPLF